MLPDPETPAGRAGLAALLADPARAVIAIDFDGTLAPIVPRPEDARPADGAVAVLAALAQRVGVCAVVTGRAAATVVDLAGLKDVPGLLVLGHYGLERWHDGRLESPPVHLGVQRARDRLPDVLTGAAEGVAVEDKEHSLVVHTRRAADPQAEFERLRDRLAALAGELELELVPGRYAWELRPPGVDKGGALRTLAEERGAAAVAFVGDDVGDLPAYGVVDALRSAGVPGVKVCSVSAEATALREHADLVLDGPAGVVAFLQDLVATLGDTP